MVSLVKDNRHLRIGITTTGVLVFYIIYVVIFTLLPEDSVLSAVLSIAPGILSIGLLIFAAGFNPDDCFLIPHRISLKGMALLALFCLALIPVLVSRDFVGWDWKIALIYAPLSGIAQELFFRASLLPALLKIFKGRRPLAVFIQAILFTCWHLPLVLMTAPIAGVVGVSIVTLIGGVIWGWQVQHDHTVYWTLGQHIAYLMLMSMFSWG
jgi:membrane protease YdiL (CAAX protease family)